MRQNFSNHLSYVHVKLFYAHGIQSWITFFFITLCFKLGHVIGWQICSIVSDLLKAKLERVLHPIFTGNPVNMQHIETATIFWWNISKGNASLLLLFSRTKKAITKINIAIPWCMPCIDISTFCQKRENLTLNNFFTSLCHWNMGFKEECNSSGTILIVGFQFIKSVVIRV